MASAPSLPHATAVGAPSAVVKKVSWPPPEELQELLDAGEARSVEDFWRPDLDGGWDLAAIYAALEVLLQRQIETRETETNKIADCDAGIDPSADALNVTTDTGDNNKSPSDAGYVSSHEGEFPGIGSPADEGYEEPQGQEALVPHCSMSVGEIPIIGSPAADEGYEEPQEEEALAPSCNSSVGVSGDPEIIVLDDDEDDGGETCVAAESSLGPCEPPEDSVGLSRPPEPSLEMPAPPEACTPVECSASDQLDNVPSASVLEEETPDLQPKPSFRSSVAKPSSMKRSLGAQTVNRASRLKSLTASTPKVQCPLPPQELGPRPPATPPADWLKRQFAASRVPAPRSSPVPEDVEPSQPSADEITSVAEPEASFSSNKRPSSQLPTIEPTRPEKAGRTETHVEPSKSASPPNSELFSSVYIVNPSAPNSENRPFDLRTVIVNFANVGSTYGERVLRRSKSNNEKLFDYDGVRRCVQYLIGRGFDVIGVVYENYWAVDRGGTMSSDIPQDIDKMCKAVVLTPKLTGEQHQSADDEMTIRLAYQRNCRFLDNDNYRDWRAGMRDQVVRSWLERCQDVLQMRYFFDPISGAFDILEGNIPTAKLALRATSDTLPPQQPSYKPYQNFFGRR